MINCGWRGAKWPGRVAAREYNPGTADLKVCASQRLAGTMQSVHRRQDKQRHVCATREAHILVVRQCQLYGEIPSVERLSVSDAARGGGWTSKGNSMSHIYPKDRKKYARERADEALGMNAEISRRDFLNASLIAAGGILLGPLNPVQLLAQKTADGGGNDWDGPGGAGDYSVAHGNPWDVMQASHAIRDGVYDRLAPDTVETGEIFDCVVVGGGISGLSAALFFRDSSTSVRTCLVLENHPIFGGEARRNEFLVDGHRLMAPQGAVQFPIPFPGGFIDRFYREVGFNYWEFQYQTWAGPSPALPLGRTVYSLQSMMPPSFGFYFGRKFGQQPGLWIVDPIGKKFEGAPVSEATRRDLMQLFQRSERTGPPPNPPFKYRGDEHSRWLDSMSLEDYLVKEKGVSRETVRTFVSPGVAGGVGLGADVVSAFVQYCWLPAKDYSYETGIQQAPGGMTGLARHIVKSLIPDAIAGDKTLHDVCRNPINFQALDRPGHPTRIRLGSTVVRVEHEGGDPYTSEFVSVTYIQGGKVYRLKARGVVMAGGGWVTKHVVRDLPAGLREAYDQFHYGAYLRANVAVRNWKFLYDLGLSGGCWFEGFGKGTSVRTVATFGADSKTTGPDSPTVFTIDQAFVYPGLPIEEQGAKGRMELMSTSFRDYERRIRETLADVFASSGFEPRRDIAGIVLNRWGHALLAPQPGFFFGKDGKPAPRDLLRVKPFGRIAFAHTDLGGAQDHVSSLREAHRAVGQIIEVTW